MRIIVLGLPQAFTVDPCKDSRFSDDAFASITYSICRMMCDRGHEVIHLGVEGSCPPCSKNVDIMPRDRWAPLYDSAAKRAVYGNDIFGNPYLEYTKDYRKNLLKAIDDLNLEPYSSIVCASMGPHHAEVTSSIQQFVVESSVGYSINNCYAKYRVFESYPWMHTALGLEGKPTGDCWYDVVIPPAFDPDIFGPVVPTKDKDDYFLMICRLNEDKGIRIACDVAQRLGKKIKIAGVGDITKYDYPNIEYVGMVGPQERNELMRHAKALFSPTRYVEPFGMVVIEANLAGCPAITTDWGGFIDSVLPGKTGYRCRNLEQFLWAAKNIDSIDPNDCRKWGENFSYDKVGQMYEEFFQEILNLNGKGWYQENDSRTELSYLSRTYP
jgi:glycosyltransferase involved in cell wall biosynthesis